MRMRLETVRGAFWLPSAIAVPLAILAGFGLTELERHVQVDLDLFGFADQASARAVLQTIATATVSVAGLSFSVTLVALTLAAQQLSPRVLRTFRSDRIAQLTLASFLGTFAFALIVLARLSEADATRVPVLAVATAILLALASFGMFVAFIGDIVVALQASTVIERISADADQAIRGRSPRGIGAPADEAVAALHLADQRSEGEGDSTLRSGCGGYLTHIDAGIVDAASRHGVLIRQLAMVGDYVISEQTLADVWGNELDATARGELVAAFKLAPERTITADVCFPIRQLADIALRALSPGVNDPTTAENAMSALADILVRCSADDDVELIRVDGNGVPRFVATAASFDDLVQLGFEQVRRAAAGEPVIEPHLRRLLERVRETERGRSSDLVARYLAQDA